MQFTQILATFVLASTTFAVPSPDPNANIDSRELTSRVLCKKPFCTARCPDGTPYDCCVVYIRDPCTGHYCKSKTDITCVCQCPNGAGTYLCNVNYIQDPCKISAS